MNKYYVDQTAQPNGDHVVHKEGCPLLALARYTKELGLYVNCHSALVKAMDFYPNTANGCKTCAEQCHCPTSD